MGACPVPNASQRASEAANAVVDADADVTVPAAAVPDVPSMHSDAPTTSTPTDCNGQDRTQTTDADLEATWREQLMAIAREESRKSTRIGKQRERESNRKVYYHDMVHPVHDNDPGILPSD
eukprot:m.192550 g.192550  ORF g.192550 m.192550 type:complete len:121 (-) comp18675_c0_seq1:1814-2176(-)